MKVAAASKLLRNLRPNGAIHNALFVYQRLVPNAGNPNDGSLTSSSSTNGSENTVVELPRLVEDPIGHISTQLLAQELLAQKGAHGASLSEAVSRAYATGVICEQDRSELTEINRMANEAKHLNFGKGRARGQAKFKRGMPKPR